jgi:hypothetical protein
VGIFIFGSLPASKGEIILCIKEGEMIGSIIGGMFCIIAGLWLFSVKEDGSPSWLVPISKGIGFYCIGKGVYIIFQGVQLFRIKNLVERDIKVFSNFIEVIQENAKIDGIVERIYQTLLHRRFR